MQIHSAHVSPEASEEIAAIKFQKYLGSWSRLGATAAGDRYGLVDQRVRQARPILGNRPHLRNDAVGVIEEGESLADAGQLRNCFITPKTELAANRLQG